MTTIAQFPVPAVMKGVQVTEFGGPDVLRVSHDIPVPKPDARQVLIQVKFAGVNPLDTYIREGKFPQSPDLPFVPGKEGAGVVVAVGDDVSKLKVGDRVYTLLTLGTYAEYSLSDEWNAHLLHDSISYKAGAAIGIAYFTAYRALYQKTKAKPGETLLIHGASGAVGLATVQMARALGMTVLGTAGTSAGMELVKRHGAHHVFNHGETGYLDQIMVGTLGKGVNVILDVLANFNLEHDLALLAQNGRIAVVGSRGLVEISPLVAILKEGAIFGIALLSATKAELEECSAFISAGQEQGWVKPEVGQEYSLSEVQTAHREVIDHTGGARGKIVLNINDN